MRKLSNKEALLLKLLAGVAVVCALGIMLVLTAPQVSTLQDQIGKFEQGIGNAKSLEVNEKELGVYYETLKKEIQKEKQSFYTADERDLTVLGIGCSR
jgi:type III secretory pathway component EscR